MNIENGIWIEDLALVNGDFWFVSGTFNGVFRYCISTKTTEFVASIPDEEYDQIRLVSNVCSYKNKIVFVPYMATKLHIFDIVTKCWTNISLIENKIQLLFLGAQVKNTILLIQNDLHYFVIYDIESNEKKIVKLPTTIKGVTGQGIVYDKKFCIGIRDTNQILKINLLSAKVEIIRIGNTEQVFHLFSSIGNKILMKDNFGNILSTNMDFSEMHIIYSFRDFDSKLNINDISFLVDNILFVFLYYAPYVYIVDLKKGEQKRICNINYTKKYLIKLCRQWGFVKQIDQNIMFNFVGDNMVYSVVKDNYRKEFILEYSASFRKWLSEQIFFTPKVHIESWVYRLVDLFDYLNKEDE